MAKFWTVMAVAIGLFVSPTLARAQSEVRSDRYGAIVVEADTGKILFADHADRVLHPASLTKLMTLYMAFSALRSGKLDESTQLTVSRYATQASPTKLNLKAGETVPVKSAILGLITRSANDAARVLAEGIGGNETRFAEMMTAQAKQLGMTHTQFKNASGLPNPQQLSTPKDMAILARAIITQFPEYYELFSRRSFVYRGVTFTNHNHLMERYPGMDGMKTGYVAASGFNLVSSAVQNGTRLIGVVFGGRSAALRDNHMAGLLDRAFMDASNYRRPGPSTRMAQNFSQGSLPEPASYKMDEADEDTGAVNNASDPKQDYPDAAPLQAKTPLQHVLARATTASTDNDEEQQDAAAAETASSDNTTNANLNINLAKGNWGVQLGAFRSKKDARIAINRAKKKYKTLHHASGVIAATKTKGGVPIYHARLIGLTQASASRACSALQARGRDCTPLKPTG